MHWAHCTQDKGKTEARIGRLQCKQRTFLLNASGQHAQKREKEKKNVYKKLAIFKGRRRAKITIFVRNTHFLILCLISKHIKKFLAKFGYYPRDRREENQLFFYPAIACVLACFEIFESIFLRLHFWPVHTFRKTIVSKLHYKELLVRLFLGWKFVRNKTMDILNF